MLRTEQRQKHTDEQFALHEARLARLGEFFAFHGEPVVPVAPRPILTVEQQEAAQQAFWTRLYEQREQVKDDENARMAALTQSLVISQPGA
jgi:hypothetical protein